MIPLLLIFYLIICTVQGKNMKEPDTKIIGGTDAPEGAAPYQVSLRRNNGHYCGGTILNEKWIMTAGHCCRSGDEKNVTLVVGTNTLSSGGDKYYIKRIVVHPDYTLEPDVINDIALLEVTKKINFTRKVQPVALPEKDTLDDANLLVTGWGTVNRDKVVASEKLQMLNVTALDPELCHEIHSVFKKSQICTSSFDIRKGICQGDSGGPLVEGNAVVGVVSFSVYRCVDGYPDGNTRVFYFKDWISKTMKS